MKPTRRSLLPVLPLAIALCLPSLTSRAAVLQWDSDGLLDPPLPPEDPNFGLVIDGFGDWDLALTNWTADGGATNTAWTNPLPGETAHDALFGAGIMGGGINITDAIVVRDITFAVLPQGEMYGLSGAKLTLTQTPAPSTITTNNDAHFAAQVTGRGFTKAGTSTLTFGAASGNLFPTSSSYPGNTPLPSYAITAGALLLDGNNTKNTLGMGTITIASGATLKLLKSNNIVDDRTVIHIDEGGTFDLNDVAGTISGLAVMVSEKFGYLEGGGSFLPRSQAWVLHMGGGAEHHAFGGVIDGQGQVFVDAANIKSYSTQEFTAANTWTGKLSVFAGTLAFTVPESLGFSSDPVIDLGAAKAGDNPVHGLLRYTGAVPLAFTRPLHLASAGAAGTALGGGGVESSGSDPAAVVSVTGPVTSAAGNKAFIIGGTHEGDNVLNTALMDAIPDGVNRFAVSLIKSGPGTWRLPLANDFTGGVEMNAGVLHLDNPGAFNSTDGLQNSLRLHGGVLHLNGNSLTLGSGTSGWGLAGAGGTIRNTAPVAAALTVNQNVAANQVFRGTIDDTGGGPVSLIKQGPGSLTLAAAAQMYAGPTYIQDGTLKLEAVAAALPVSGAAWHLDASDASTVTVTDGFVTEWRDKTAFRRHLTPPVLKGNPPPLSTPTYESSAQNGRNAVRFDGISDMLSLNTVTGFAADAGTIFVVCSNSENGNGSVKGGGLIGGNGFNSATAQRGIRGAKGGVWYGSGENTDFSTPNGSEFRVNGALTTSVTPQGANYWHTVTATRAGTAMKVNSIGGFSTLDTTGTDEFWFKGDIGEVIVYPAVLSAEQRSRVEAYLRQKWFGGTVSANLLPAATPVTVAAGATFDCGVPQTIASLELSGSLKTGAPAGELISSGAASLLGGARIFWEVSDWTGAAGTGYDVLTAASLNITADAITPVTVKIGQATLANFSNAARTFTLARTTGAITGFNTAAFVLDATAFTAGSGMWSIAKTGNSLELSYTPPAHPAGYDEWIAEFDLTGAQSDPAADPDGDRLTNVHEFTVHSDPSKSSADAGAIARIFSVNGGNAFTLTLPVLTGAVFSGPVSLTATTASGVICTIEGSDDPAAWLLDIDEVIPAVTAGLPTLPAAWGYHTFRTPGPVNADNSGFMRIKLQSAP